MPKIKPRKEVESKEMDEDLSSQCQYNHHLGVTDRVHLKTKKAL